MQTESEAIVTDDLIRALIDLLGAGGVSRQCTERMMYARDLWPLHTMRVREGKLPPLPGVVVWPTSELEVAAVVQLARRHRVPITPYGAGSGVLGGAMPFPGAIIMDLKRMAQLVSIDAAASVGVVEPGMLGAHLEDQLNIRGYTLGHFPSSLMTATVGGYVATRSAGQFSSRYGKIEDMVVSMRFVAGTGEIFDTADESLPAGGPDLNQILLGSEGTLGIVTQVTLKLHPTPPATAFRGIRFPSVEAGLEAMRLLMQAGLRPSVLRLYDEIDTFLVGKGDDPVVRENSAVAGNQATQGNPAQAMHPPETVHVQAPTLGGRVKGWTRGLIDRHPGVARGAVRLALGRPALIEALSHRVLPHEVLLILGFEGEPEEVEQSLASALERCARVGGRDLGPGPGLRWFARRYDVSFKMPAFFHLGAFVDTIEVASTWDRIPALYHAVRRAVSEETFIMAHFSHAYPEGVSIYFSLGGAADGLEASEQRYYRAWEKAMEVVLAHQATVSHHHGVGRARLGGAAIGWPSARLKAGAVAMGRIPEASRSAPV
mgnify:CR=1 FL=1